jgi:Ca2+-transporting ATPase
VQKTDQVNAWHSLELQDLFERLDTQSAGLGQKQAEARLLEYGMNCLPESRPRPWWQIFLLQFQSPLIYILGLAACVSILLGDAKDGAFIGLVLTLNSAIGCYQEWRAEQSSYALRKLLEIRSTVIRDREAIEISAREVVPGHRMARVGESSPSRHATCDRNRFRDRRVVTNRRVPFGT